VASETFAPPTLDQLLPELFEKAVCEGSAAFGTMIVAVVMAVMLFCPGRARLTASPGPITCGNRMSPTHANKGGARYRYYVSQAVLQRKPLAAGAIGRVPAAEIEELGPLS
jgi:hypothetical protein